MPEAAALPNPDEPAEVVQATDGQEEDATPPEAAAAPEVDEKEEQARRFARLLVSEIVLYNEVQVKEGQKNADLLSRLKDPISRSREAYEQRFGRETLRYFDEEMVRTLAQGDPSLLGAQAG